MSANQPRVSYKGTEIYEYAEQAWSTISHSGRLMKYKPTQDPFREVKKTKWAVYKLNFQDDFKSW